MKSKYVIMTLFFSVLLTGCGAPDDNQTSNLAPATSEEQVSDLPNGVSTTDWELLLVNKDHPLPDHYEETVTWATVDNDQSVDERIVPAWGDFKDAAAEAGFELELLSAYRSIDHQTINYDWHVDHYLEQGFSPEEAKVETEKYIAIPGHSEHHTGLALDIVDREWAETHDDPFVEEYDTQASQQWMVAHGPEYGFVLRYLENKEDITGVSYESWHFRYVGEKNAQYMAEHNLTLEEYLDELARHE